ncbi:MAG: 50S ribosomal protein L37ae [Candidatus Aenigmarchaeota archaeon]|nr:50S ribosomal protein L37ae [Candidatus Aenigmarchaeota archaeon]
MSKRTKRIGSAGRYGVRFGQKIRKMVSDIEAVQKSKHTCPACTKTAVVREASGIWKCNICGCVFAGGAYNPAYGAERTISTLTESEKPFKKDVEIGKPASKRDKFKGREKPKAKPKEKAEPEKAKKNKGK